MSTGIKCFQDERELGDSFYQLFPVVKTRDSCQPERAAEHSCSNRDLHDDTTSSTGQETDQAETDTGKSTKMFVPIETNSDMCCDTVLFHNSQPVKPLAL
ncbi:unnamed protein product [Pocillopora meandrina]|uniref:Uncharacterized protein n=1 Tax=Pocillopora meandrina TaxID=46732 RepID=A0AAU9X2D6_9CNID|nr:unnamed protein product [Pocillopora meandrina]